VITVYLHPGITGRARTDDPREAIERVGRRLLGYPQIATIEHHQGGDTYWVEFYERGKYGSTSRVYVAQVTRGGAA
jgi:hypothetical protein